MEMEKMETQVQSTASSAQIRYKLLCSLTHFNSIIYSLKFGEPLLFNIDFDIPYAKYIQ